MKTLFLTVGVSALVLVGDIAAGGTWVDSYWPLHDGDTKTFVYQGANQLTMDVSYYGGNQYRISYDSPAGSGSEFHELSSAGVYLFQAKAGWINVYFSPSVLLMNDSVLQNGGSLTSSTTVSQQGVHFPATYTIKISQAGKVTVPAGTFSNCRSISVTEKATVPGQGTVTVNLLTAVLAPDVGIVKKLVSSGVWAELVSGTIDGTDVGILASGSPVVTIKSPTAAQRFMTNNNSIPITGTVAGYMSGMEVFYRINSAGSWEPATVAGTNWFGSVLAQTGTNRLEAYAEDSVGRTSPITQSAFQYVVTSVLGVRTNGLGKITPNLNGQMLEIGRNYTLTAAPVTGFAFTNWTDDVGTALTNRSLLSFTMQSNLVLWANFVDAARPVLAITNISSGRRVSNAVFVVKGTARDNFSMGAVFWQLNGGGWSNAVTANNWTNWTTPELTLVPGTNLISAYAVDATGNASLTNAVKLVYVLSAPVHVFIVGSGTLKPNYNGAMLEIGKSYTMKATPAKGFAFKSLGGDLWSNATITFTMRSNYTYTATFVDVARPVNIITSPKTKQSVSNGVITVTGKASDNVGVRAVWYQLNGGGWSSNAITTTGWTNWSIVNLPVVSGTNILEAFAIDAAGNVSLTNKIVFRSVLSLSGTVTYGGTKKGKVFIYLASETNSSDVVLIVTNKSTGTYSIPLSKLDVGNYIVRAAMDSNADNRPSPGDPVGVHGVTGVPVVVTNTGLDSIANVDVVLNDSDGTAPVLVSAAQVGAKEISFTFSEAMMPGYSVSWASNVDPSTADRVWSADARTITYVFSEDLPVSTSIEFELNPAGYSGFGFSDWTGTKVASISDSISTAASWP